MNEENRNQTTEKLKRLDLHDDLRGKILPYCRLKPGEVWEDPGRGHRVGVLDATLPQDIQKIFGKVKAHLIINDPPYNVRVGSATTPTLFKKSLGEYMDFSARWVVNAMDVMHPDSYLYVWIGTDVRDNFQPLPDFMIMMRSFETLKPRNFITLRNQRGYGTQ